jgi:hypothetical protein
MSIGRPILTEDVKVISNSLQFWSVNHVTETNVVVHKLAKEVFSLTNEQIHMEEVSRCILDIVIAE